ncbi:MBL fold metallo-hydrolase [Acinetobacter sp. ANC 3832]|uniref:MBL fold metallo-hydrolase n=1 Tax=Acinetobacter sp. ANC 3832 TaxID=1977874 RepID=UPI000A335619|nr:MBL fold metallo-hydrolase [Acinetobacter sp. ANC 3832]OTG92381.1 MBL fold metallo-hydrolase [Acinetobacter sp. ANC 3832]
MFKFKKLFLNVLSIGIFSAGSSATAQDNLILLGTKGGPSLYSSKSLPQSSALVINKDVYVIDAGYGASYRLLEAKVPLKNIKAIFITHLHSDHILDYPALLMNSWLSSLDHEIKVYGPKGTKEMTDNLLKAYNVDIKLRYEDEGREPLSNFLKVYEFDEGDVYKDENVTVTAKRVPHKPFKMGEAFAFKFDTAKQQKIVFSGDTNYYPPFAKFAQHADILVHEVAHADGIDRLAKRMGYGPSFRDAVIAHHITPQDVGKTATNAKVKQLVLSHIVPVGDPDLTDDVWKKDVGAFYQGEITVGKDGMIIPLK